MTAPSAPLTSAFLTIDPTEFIDYCSHACEAATVPAGLPFPITPWDGEVCGCCGAEWGIDEDEGTCRGIHVEGDVWRRLLDGAE